MSPIPLGACCARAASGHTVSGLRRYRCQVISPSTAPPVFASRTDISLLGGAADEHERPKCCLLVAADEVIEPVGRMRRIGVTMLLAEDDPQQKTWNTTRVIRDGEGSGRHVKLPR